MTKRNKTVLIALPLLILAGVAVFLLCTNQEGFTGSRVKNPDEYLLDIEKMNENVGCYYANVESVERL